VFFHLYSHVKMFQYKIDFPVATTPNSQANFKLNQLNHEKPKIISRARQSWWPRQSQRRRQKALDRAEHRTSSVAVPTLPLSWHGSGEIVASFLDQASVVVVTGGRAQLLRATGYGGHGAAGAKAYTNKN
jgi:hypothetical protein